MIFTAEAGLQCLEANGIILGFVFYNILKVLVIFYDSHGLIGWGNLLID